MGDVVGAKPERFQEYEKWHQALLNVTTQQHRNPYTNVYTLALADALKISETLIQIWNNVTLFTSSEFARTLDSNGGGSDHGYAGNHFLIGGALRGGKIFNQFPESLLLGARMDLGRGRLIPDYPWESFLVPLAQWMGVEDSWLAHAFPNLHYFNSTRLLIPVE